MCPNSQDTADLVTCIEEVLTMENFIFVQWLLGWVCISNNILVHYYLIKVVSLARSNIWKLALSYSNGCT